jgi:hypothetical protein
MAIIPTFATSALLFNNLLSWVDFLAVIFAIVGGWNILTCWTAGKIESKIGGAAETAFDNWLSKIGEKKADKAADLVGAAGEAAEKGDLEATKKLLAEASQKLKESDEAHKKQNAELMKQLESFKQTNLSPEEIAKLKEAYNALIKDQRKTSTQQQTQEFLEDASIRGRIPPKQVLEQVRARIESTKQRPERQVAAQIIESVARTEAARQDTIVGETKEKEQKIKEIKRKLEHQKKYVIAENKYGKELLAIIKSRSSKRSEEFKDKLRKEARTEIREMQRYSVRMVADGLKLLNNPAFIESVKETIQKASEFEAETLSIVGKNLKGVVSSGYINYILAETNVKRLIAVTEGWLLKIAEIDNKLDMV